MKSSLKVFLFCVVVFFSTGLNAQPGTEIEVKEKPKRYQNRLLRAEKTQNKKWNFFKRFSQNSFTHFNYYYNSQVKLDELLARAKASHKDNYDSLLSYYNYSLSTTAQEKTEIDSLIYKCTAGILLHDLRSDWVDNMYLLLGQAYFYKNDLDSAYHTFQYINYAFSPKEDGGYHIPIGSNASNEAKIFTIATDEKANLVKKTMSRPPSRNDALVWLVRVFIESGKMGEAIGMIEILRNDPAFPKRLKADLDELSGYWFYKQKNYDSAAHYIVASLDKADGVTEKARKQYLAGQLLTLAGNAAGAAELFNESARKTNDPVMEVNATLNAVKAVSSSNDEIQKRIAELLKLASKDKYAQYRDVIYYTAAKAELERKNLPGAEQMLLKAVHPKNAANQEQKSRSFFLLADVAYKLEKYTDAARFYDSLDVAVLKGEEQRIATSFKPVLGKIAKNIKDVQVQDSLLYIASLSEQEKIEYYKKAAAANRKKKRKERAEAAGEGGTPGAPFNLSSSNDKPKDLFGDTKGEWYFNSNSAKSRGFSEFQQRWGKRPNVDNWRRDAAIERSLSVAGDVLDVDIAAIETLDEKGEKKKETEVSTEVPSTKEEISAAEGVIEKALLDNGNLFLEELSNYPAAVRSYKELLKRFPKSQYKEEALFKLSFAAGKEGDKELADSAASVLSTEFGTGKWNKMMSNQTSADDVEEGATKLYENIYNLFVEGDFERAKAEKEKADSLYGSKYWTDQLLFIESIYYIKQKEDSTAILKLTALTKKTPPTPLSERAITMIDVLKRRKEIEEYLTKLDAKVEEEEVAKRVDLDTYGLQDTRKPDSSFANNKLKVTELPKRDSLKLKPDKPDTLASKPLFSFNAAEKHFVAVVLDRVDNVYINEGKNSFVRFNGSRMSNPPPVSINKIDAQYTILLLGPFKDAGDAVDYVTKTRPLTAARILPWLSAAKYSYLVISEENMKLLQENKQVEAYRNMIKQALPGVF